MEHELRREFPLSSHTITPLPETDGILGRIVRSVRTRGLRYSMVSVVNVLFGGGMLVILQHWMSPTRSNIVAVGLSAVPAYYMNRAWVWGKRGRSHMRKEVIPFWSFTIAGAIISTVAIRIVQDHSRNRFLILFVQLAAFGVLWVIRFFLLDRLFHVEIFEDDTPDED